MSVGQVQGVKPLSETSQELRMLSKSRDASASKKLLDLVYDKPFIYLVYDKPFIYTPEGYMGVQPYFVVVEKSVFWNTLVCNMSLWLSKKVFFII